MQVIYLIRHAETTFNEEGRIQGFTESSLSELGLEQAKRLGERLKDVPLVRVFCSPLKRAMDTCHLALNGSVDTEARDGLREINLGEWEGKTAVELRQTHPHEVKQWFRKPSSVRIEGGESIAQFRERVTAEMNTIREAYPEQTFAVFTHGGVICTYLTSLLGMDLDDIWRFKIRNASVTRIIFPQDRPRIDLLGDIHHLDGFIRQPPEAPYRIFP